MIAAIFGVYGSSGSNKAEIEEKLDTKNMTFEEKRKLFEAEYPNKTSPEERAKAREALNYIASHPQSYIAKESAPSSSTKPVSANILSSYSWTPVPVTNSENNLTAPRVGKLTPASNSKTNSTMKLSVPALTNESAKSILKELSTVSNGTTKIEGLDSLSQMTYDAAYSAKTQSPSLDQTSMRMQENSEFPTSLSTCSE
ncbi:hypothetical protein CAEBREN_07515 [Caenorhabditis brenneri]|uniref:Uncharacterized protein n=1 Tax=Caenorhabditis brenneri TaxID=135651 RepID=G0MES7_CAEBE|nr:hypothetical protein CAEBREN_07515 [Caenorhabditis brenneri]